MTNKENYIQIKAHLEQLHSLFVQYLPDDFDENDFDFIAEKHVLALKALEGFYDT